VAQMCGGPFLKELVKQKQSPFGFLHTGSARRSHLFCSSSSANRVRFIVALACFGFVSVSSLRCGKLQSFFSKAIAPNTFLREVPLTVAVSSSAA
jgi:hypothetical protein